jgi:hypothetical protein
MKKLILAASAFAGLIAVSAAMPASAEMRHDDRAVVTAYDHRSDYRRDDYRRDFRRPVFHRHVHYDRFHHRHWR